MPLCSAVQQDNCVATSRRLKRIELRGCTHAARKQLYDMRSYAESALDIMLIGARLAAAHRRG
jgi:hypothetical protein